MTNEELLSMHAADMDRDVYEEAVRARTAEAQLRADLAAARAERNAANEGAAEARMLALTCVFCGYEAIHGETLRMHLAGCVEHPAVKERDEARREREQVEYERDDARRKMSEMALRTATAEGELAALRRRVEEATAALRKRAAAGDCIAEALAALAAPPVVRVVADSSVPIGEAQIRDADGNVQVRLVGLAPPVASQAQSARPECPTCREKGSEACFDEFRAQPVAAQETCPKCNHARHAIEACSYRGPAGGCLCPGVAAQEPKQPDAPGRALCMGAHCTSTATHGPSGRAVVCWSHAGDFPEVKP